jgi:hypothetical protein
MAQRLPPQGRIPLLRWRGLDESEEHHMSDWMAIAQWEECQKLAKPGIVFEIRNARGQSMWTQCVMPLPPMPFDWTSPPVEFRAVPEAPPRHSDPIPPPAKR